MSKKKFTEGLESLFGEEQEEGLLQQEEGFLFPTTELVVKKKGKAGQKKSNSKTFSDDIESFLSDAFEDSFEAQLSQRKTNPSPTAAIKKRSNKPRSGLDALIRSTVRPSAIKIKGMPTRRVTLVFDEEKLQQLKTIARKERVYLKDIINEIVGEFIESYDDDHPAT